VQRNPDRSRNADRSGDGSGRSGFEGKTSRVLTPVASPPEDRRDGGGEEDPEGNYDPFLGHQQGCEARRLLYKLKASKPEIAKIARDMRRVNACWVRPSSVTPSIVIAPASSKLASLAADAQSTATQDHGVIEREFGRRRMPPADIFLDEIAPHPERDAPHEHQHRHRAEDVERPAPHTRILPQTHHSPLRSALDPRRSMRSSSLPDKTPTPPKPRTEPGRAGPIGPKVRPISKALPIFPPTDSPPDAQRPSFHSHFPPTKTGGSPPPPDPGSTAPLPIHYNGWL
jgi:hypothetical protein